MCPFNCWQQCGSSRDVTVRHLANPWHANRDDIAFTYANWQPLANSCGPWFTGLKIRFPERGVSVRARPPVLLDWPQNRAKRDGAKRNPDSVGGGFGGRRTSLFHRFGCALRFGEPVAVGVEGDGGVKAIPTRSGRLGCAGPCIPLHPATRGDARHASARGRVTSDLCA